MHAYDYEICITVRFFSMTHSMGISVEIRRISDHIQPTFSLKRPTAPMVFQGAAMSRRFAILNTSLGNDSVLRAGE